LAWPTAADLWQEDLPAAQESFAALCAAIGAGEQLEVLVPDEAAERKARAALEGLRPRFHRISYGDIWLRDIAPIFVRDGATVRAARFAFNGWGGKYVLPGDDRVADRVAQASALATESYPWVLEGGSIDPDGEGTLLTTRQCLLNRNRNPGLGQVEIEARLAGSLGARRVLWLEEGLLNDHTDGHVDTLARFVAPGRVVCMRPSGSDDPNVAALVGIARDLAAMRDARGRKLDVVQIPSPGRVLDEDGEVMPASYVNFYIANEAVAVPIYGVPYDAEAVASVAKLFPGRRTVGIPARAILTGGGAFHCITQQQPEAGA
jgi:agmatine deiminase